MPGEFDGFVTPVPGGFEAAASGAVIGAFERREDAVAAARAAAAGRPVWLVDESGAAREAAAA